jgi:hypothetical protein
MTIEQLRQYHQARPFRRFVLHIADGSTVRVDHPEFLAHTPMGRTVLVGLPDESSRVIDILMITQIEVPPQNGRRQGRRPAGGQAR